MINQRPDLIECPHCRAKADTRSNWCPNCGLNFARFGVSHVGTPRPPAPRNQAEASRAIVLFVLGAVAFVVTLAFTH